MSVRRVGLLLVLGGLIAAGGGAATAGRGDVGERQPEIPALDGRGVGDAGRARVGRRAGPAAGADHERGAGEAVPGSRGRAVTEDRWPACRTPEPMLALLRGKAGGRKLRLFAVAWARA